MSVKKSLVYTRTGDRGKTSLVGGERVSKTDVRIESYGNIDELNSYIALLVSNVSTEEYRDFLIKIQHKLFVVGAYLATNQDNQKIPCSISQEDVTEIEIKIDVIDSQLPKLNSFILPGGSSQAAISDICRTVCRRAERRILALAEQTYVDENLLTYVNRLSDFFFVLSRKLNVDNGVEEIRWINNC